MRKGILILSVGFLAQGFIPPATIDLRDEGTSQGRITALNCAGAGVSCTVSGGVGTATISGGGGGSFALTLVEIDLGSIPLFSGTFDITGLSGLTPNASVLITQAVGPYTGKGDRVDEVEMDIVVATAYVFDTNTIRVYWNCLPKFGPVRGNIKFQYVVG